MSRWIIFVLLFPTGLYAQTKPDTSSLYSRFDSIPIGNRSGWFTKRDGGTERRYCEGVPCHGRIKDHYDNGQVEHSGYYINGRLNRRVKDYYENGQLEATGRTDRNYRIGKWKHYYQNGKKLAIIIWDDGLERIYKTWYESGKKESDERWTKGFKLKYAKFYHENGNLKSVYTQPNHKKAEAFYKEYHENGKLKEEGTYKIITGKDNGSQDVKHGTWKLYNDKGVLIKTEQYQSGRLLEDKK